MLGQIEPDLRPDDLLVFQTPGGSPIRYENFRRRAWNPVVLDLFGGSRRVTPHMLRHTWASLHLSRGTPIEWVRKMGGWASTQMLLDTYAHFLPRDMRGFSNALRAGDGPTRTQR
ncbi:MAG: tyrosine-type recombinase/integrase, partial [Myxococcota bacterium]